MWTRQRQAQAKDLVESPKNKGKTKFKPFARGGNVKASENITVENSGGLKTGRRDAIKGGQSPEGV